MLSGLGSKAIEKRFAPDGPSDSSVQYHGKVCMPAALQRVAGEADLATATAAREIARSAVLMAQRWHRAAEDVMDEVFADDGLKPLHPVEKMKAIKDGSSTLDRLTKALDFYARMTGELRSVPVDVTKEPEFEAMVNRVVEALAPYPDAMAAVKAVLEPGK
ncbi:hypothetical protein BE21_57570 [Sorangium cellulosum]|uniref:Uncharacterized protein n=1 Tax=Sorangium cellulosum TaxID=56 RepID=A0A150U3D8_SORCE|nr:hypothetical protein BE21_57570 [Sorangium cellulosum]